MFGRGGGGNWWAYVRFDEERDRPQISRQLLRRVAQFAQPYRIQIVLMLVGILVGSLLNLLPPLLLRDLIDHALPHAGQPGNLTRLNWLALGMVLLPLFG